MNDLFSRNSKTMALPFTLQDIMDLDGNNTVTAPPPTVTMVAARPRRKVSKPSEANYRPCLERLIGNRAMNAQLHPDAAVLINDLFARLATRLSCHFLTILNTSRTTTLSADMIASAVFLVLSPSLAEQSVDFGLERVKQFKASKDTQGRISRSGRAGLTVDVALATTVLRAKLPMKNGRATALSASAPVMLAAVIEIVAIRIFDVIGPGTDRITARVVRRAIQSDHDLSVSIGPFVLFDK